MCYLLVLLSRRLMRIQLRVITVHSMFTRLWRVSQRSQGKIHQDHSGWDPLSHPTGYSHSYLPAIAWDTLWVPERLSSNHLVVGLEGCYVTNCILSRCLWPPGVHWQRYGGAWKVGGVWPSDHWAVGGGAFAVFHDIHPQGEQHGGIQEDRLLLVDAVHDTNRGEISWSFHLVSCMSETLFLFLCSLLSTFCPPFDEQQLLRHWCKYFSSCALAFFFFPLFIVALFF